MTTWSGTPVRTARAYWATRLPRPCHLCGRIVDGTTPWVVEHIIERARGGALTDRNNQAVSHRSCSDRSGGRIRAALTNSRKPAVVTRLASARARGLRGV